MSCVGGLNVFNGGDLTWGQRRGKQSKPFNIHIPQTGVSRESSTNVSGLAGRNELNMKKWRVESMDRGSIRTQKKLWTRRQRMTDHVGKAASDRGGGTEETGIVGAHPPWPVRIEERREGGGDGGKGG